jgi:formiminotetrahydrofolate cyclodeaminase
MTDSFEMLGRYQPLPGVRGIGLATPAQQAEIDAHWAAVRAGLHSSQDHVFSLDTRSQIEARKQRVNRYFDRIAQEMREIINLATAEGGAP